MWGLLAFGDYVHLSFSTNSSIISYSFFTFLPQFERPLGPGFLKVIGKDGRRRNKIKGSLIPSTGNKLSILIPSPCGDSFSESWDRHPARARGGGLRDQIQPSMAASWGSSGEKKRTDNRSQLPSLSMHFSEPSRQLMITQWYLTAHPKFTVSLASNHQVSEEVIGAVSCCPH